MQIGRVWPFSLLSYAVSQMPHDSATFSVLTARDLELRIFFQHNRAGYLEAQL
jgi:hypothetical protein